VTQDDKEGRTGESPASTTDASPTGESAAPAGATGERMDLPKWNRARVKRKTAGQGQEDALQQGIRQAGRFTLQRAPMVLLGIVAIGALVAGVQWLRSSRAEDRAEATRLLATAVGYEARGVVEDVQALTKDRKRPFPIPLFDSEEKQDEATRAALDRVRSDAPKSAAEVVASLVRAAQHIEIRAFADAEGVYRVFLQEHPDHELAFLAREGLALALEGQGKLDEALAAADAVVGREGDFYRDQGLWHRARLLEAQGKKDEALAVYKQYVAEYPLKEPSIARESVIERLEELAPELVPEDSAMPGVFP